MSLSGSPRGTIRIHPTPKDVDELQEEEIAESKRSANIVFNKRLHPFVDTSERNESKHIFVVYPETVEDKEIDGCYFVVIDDLKPKGKIKFDFWGTADDFIFALLHEIPSINQVTINTCGNMFPPSIIKIFQTEFSKHAVAVFSVEEISYTLESVDKKEPIDEIGVQDLAKAVEDPTLRSMMQDPFHKTRGQKLSSKMERILKIAYHVIQTPADERESDEDRWSIVPDKPSKKNEKESIEKFPTRDKAVLRLKEMDEEPVDKEPIDEEPVDEEPVDEENITASEVLQANVMIKWMTPEEGQEVAWSLRDK